MRIYNKRHLTKLSQTISESDLFSEEHSNTKIPRWFREREMQEAIVKDMGFEEGEEPTFLKNIDPSLRGTNAYYNPYDHSINYDTGEWTPGVLAHEVGHSTMDISPLSKAFNMGSDLAAFSALPLAIASDKVTTNKLAPTLLEGLVASGGAKNKLKLLKAGLKGRGAKWALGAAALGSLGTLAEEARASILGSKAIDTLEEQGILDEEQKELANKSMRNAYGTYLAGAVPALASGVGLKYLASSLIPKKYKMPIAAGLGGLGVYGTLAGHGLLNAIYKPESYIPKELMHRQLHKGEHRHE